MITAETAAHQLLVAESTHTPIAPFTSAHPDFDVVTAYRCQRLVVRARLEAGQHVVGAKIRGGRREPRADGDGEPLSGVVTSGMLAPYGQRLALDALIAPRAVPHLAFLLADDLIAPATVSSVLTGTDTVLVAVEVLDARFGKVQALLADHVADNAGATSFLLGPQVRRPAQLPDLRLLGCVLQHNGQVVATGAGAASMSHPAAAVAWLANMMHARGESLSAGSLVFSGGLTAAVPLVPGDCVAAELDGLGTVEVFV